MSNSKNISIIVFSKGRPLQLHAYLESLFKFSDAAQDMVLVLYCETEGIRYGKLISSFPDVKWVKETKFETDLKQSIENAGEYIMFGCDDVVFTSAFSLAGAADYLKNNPQVFGYSFRLGENIKPYPDNLSKDRDVLEWNWEGCDKPHYNYPWELDCTLYRKEDVRRMTCEETGAIKNPNYYEAMITPDNRSARIARKNMACSKNRGCAIVITVNRVQDTHQNGFDDSLITDIYSLDRLYNDEDNRLDIEKISSMPNSVIHVGAEYFILKKPAKGYSQARLIKKKLKNLEDRLARFPKRIYRHFERRSYENGKYAKKLVILTTEKTLEVLEEHRISFLRYGDGEIALMSGSSIPFQEYDARLAQRLKELLKLSDYRIRVGIPYYYMCPLKNLNPFVEGFAKSLSSQRRFLLKECRDDMSYIDTCITQVYQTYKEYDFDAYYARMQKLLDSRDVTVICGEGVLDRLENNALSVCRSVEYIYAPSINAFSRYDEILAAALKTDKNRLVCIVLGPTAKVLVYDLHQNGYQAWDMGHYFKDYDSYIRKRPRTEAEIAQFYKPD